MQYIAAYLCILFRIGCNPIDSKDLDTYLEVVLPSFIESPLYRQTEYYWDLDSDYPLLGYCFVDTNKIFLVKKMWRFMDRTKREKTLQHELGHCLLLLDHTEDDNNFMYPYLQ